MSFYLFSFFGIIFLLFLLSMIWPPDSPWAPWWRTSEEIARKMCKLAGIRKGDIVYDLGCGEGVVLMVAAKEFGARGFGVEIDPIRFLYSKWFIKKNGVSSKVQIKRGNLFDIDFSKANVVIVYLVPKTLNKLLPKFKRLEKGTRIVSYRYEINLPLSKYDEKSGIRIYTI